MSGRLVEMKGMSISFGGVRAVDDVSLDLSAGEVVGLLGHNGAGKSTLIKMLSGAYRPDSGEIRIDGEPAAIHSPRDARRYGIETIYQTLALAENLDAAANLFLGRELRTAWGTLDDVAMEAETRTVMARLNPHFAKFKDPMPLPTREKRALRKPVPTAAGLRAFIARVEKEARDRAPKGAEKARARMRRIRARALRG